MPDCAYINEKKKKKQQGFETAEDRVSRLVTWDIKGDKKDLVVTGK